MKMLPREERREVMREAKFEVHVPPVQGLAIKADLCLPWKKLRIMRRWMKVWGIDVASERKQRDLMKASLSEFPIKAESIPFSFNKKRGGQELRPAPLAYVTDLTSFIFHLLDERDRLKQLTWHNGLIPSNEIWLKIGGDKGGSSFKSCFQIVNVLKPNSVRNSCIFSLFEAPDSVFNIHLALDRYHDAIQELQEANWKGHSIRIFMFGDYELLGSLYGLSGASGRHCCLWCTVTSDQLKLLKCQRKEVVLRCLKRLAHQHDEFLKNGGNLKRAKLYENVIGKAFFNIPVRQVCLPGLHIILRIFQRLFNLFEDECHLLDLKISKSGGSTSFDEYVKAKSSVTSLEEEKSAITTETNQAQQILLLLLVTTTDPENNRQVQEVASLINLNSQRIVSIEQSIAQHKATLEKGFHKDDGVFVQCLDKALASFNVERQAYHGGSFIGNHIHKALKAENTLTLCKSAVDIAAEHDPSFLPEAKALSEKFQMVFSLFAACHRLYDGSSLVSEEDLIDLEKAIADFMAFYRLEFASASVLPKMHMLEEHMVPWMRSWRIGCGFMGEQGAESLHARLNCTENAYNNMRDRVERLRVVLQNHHLQILPETESLRPPPLKVKKRKDGN